MKFLALLALLFLSASAEKSRFDNYRVYSVTVENYQQLQAIQYLEEHSDAYNIFESPHLNADTEILVPPHKFSDFEELTENLGMKAKLIINNYQELIDEEIKPSRTPRVDAQYDWVSYKNLNEINAWLDQMAAQYSSVASVRNIGTTIQGRPIRLFKISKKSGNRGIFVEANIHAREWISSATATYLINELLTSTNPDIVDISTNIDWYIITNANPDGFVFSWDSNRNWRKTRAPVSALCFGVDPNRNFAYNWLTPDETGSLGASTSPCTDTYAGPSPLSENETRAIESVFADNAGKFDVFLSFHSYGHYLLTAWGHTRVPPADNSMLQTVGNAFRTALQAVNGINYAVGPTNTVLYAASGASPDHAYGHHGIKLAYTLEMRGNGNYGNYGFVLPPQFIIPNAQEVIAGLVGLVRSARTFGYLN
ncbi:hypothetical protein PVAND_002183 [Polypedilum vanderplanki]|uniref:Zinc carboxypeptidase A 1 n=1 Tax=Polypedilum vanderplanki TaxID=319348 RepID=A0A9J6BQT4_POLVA|nr:hypothetical protein PVAND_002183 [Polypedilum vanderplanki]